MTALGYEQICKLMPHTGAMCLVAGVQRWDDTEIVSTITSHRDPANPLRRGDCLPAICGVEYVAQTIGVHGRLVQRDHTKPAKGYLASLRDVALNVVRLDDLPGPLFVHARRVADAGDSVMCEFSVHADGRVLLSGRATLLISA